MPHFSVRADEVRPGDRVWNSAAAHSAFAWTRVISANKNDVGRIEIAVAAGWVMHRHPAESLAVQRGVDQEASNG